MIVSCVHYPTCYDPLVLVHARALLTGAGPGPVAYLDADLRDPDAILAAPPVADGFDLDEPVALTLIAVLQNITEPGRAEASIARLMGRLCAGSALALSMVTVDNNPQGGRRTVATYNSSGVPVVSRRRDEVVALFDGLELIEPGVVPVHHWHPGDEDRGVDDAAVYMYGGVAIKR